jgi:hypothetical protein
VERLQEPVQSCDVARDIQTVVSIKGTGQPIPEQLLPDFYAEHITLAMNRDRRRQVHALDLPIMCWCQALKYWRFLTIFLLTHYMFQPLQAIIRWDIQLDVFKDYSYYNGSVACTQLDVEMLYFLHRYFDLWSPIYVIKLSTTTGRSNMYWGPWVEVPM